MSNNLRFELDRDGVRQLLRCDEMAEGLKSMTSAIASRCGDGYANDIHYVSNRVLSSVYADTYDARRDNNENNTILRCLHD